MSLLVCNFLVTKLLMILYNRALTLKADQLDSPTLKNCG